MKETRLVSAVNASFGKNAGSDGTTFPETEEGQTQARRELYNWRLMFPDLDFRIVEYNEGNHVVCTLGGDVRCKGNTVADHAVRMSFIKSLKL